MGRLRNMRFAWLGTVALVFDELELECGNGPGLTHYVTVTCDLAGETFDRSSDLIDLA